MSRVEIRKEFIAHYDAILDALTLKQYQRLNVTSGDYGTRLNAVYSVTDSKRIHAMVADALELLPEYRRSFMRLVA